MTLLRLYHSLEITLSFLLKVNCVLNSGFLVIVWKTFHCFYCWLFELTDRLYTDLWVRMPDRISLKLHPSAALSVCEVVNGLPGAILTSLSKLADARLPLRSPEGYCWQHILTYIMDTNVAHSFPSIPFPLPCFRTSGSVWLQAHTLKLPPFPWDLE